MFATVNLLVFEPRGEQNQTMMFLGKIPIWKIMKGYLVNFTTIRTILVNCNQTDELSAFSIPQQSF